MVNTNSQLEMKSHLGNGPRAACGELHREAGGGHHFLGRDARAEHSAPHSLLPNYGCNGINCLNFLMLTAPSYGR